MKKYTFPYGGNFGPGDSWGNDIEIELTDEEAARLEASARQEPRWRLNEDPDLQDIESRVSEAAYAQECKNLRLAYDDPKEAEEAMENLGIHINYPEELQELGEAEEDGETER